MRKASQDYWTPEQAPKKGNIDLSFMYASSSRRSTVRNASGGVYDAIMPERSHASPSDQYTDGITGAIPGYARPQMLIDTTQTRTGFIPDIKEETVTNPAAVTFGGDLTQAEDLQPLNYLEGLKNATAEDRIIQVGNAAVQSEGMSHAQ